MTLQYKSIERRLCDIACRRRRRRRKRRRKRRRRRRRRKRRRRCQYSREQSVYIRKVKIGKITRENDNIILLIL